MANSDHQSDQPEYNIELENPVDMPAANPQKPWRARVAKVRTAYQAQLEKSQAANNYQFVPINPVPVADGAIPELKAPIKVQEAVDINAKVDVAEHTEHAVPLWLRSVSGYAWRLIVLAAAIVLVWYLLSRIRMVILAIFIALVLTSALRPLRNMYDRHMKRGLAVLCTMITALLIFGVLVAFVVASVAGSWAHLGLEVTNGVQRLFDLLQGPPFHLHLPFDHVNDAIAAGQGWITNNYGAVINEVWANAGRVAEWAIYLALAIFLTIFFLASGREMWQWVLNQFPQASRLNWTKAFHAGFTTFAGYARGLVLIGLIDGILAAILLFALGIPLAAPLAVLVFIGSFIEMVGAPAAMLIAGIVALATRGPVYGLIVILGVALIGQIEGHLLQPFIMGKQVQLHPVVIALSVATGTILAGIMGAILTVPIVAVAWSIYKALRPAAAAASAAAQPAKKPSQHHFHFRQRTA